MTRSNPQSSNTVLFDSRWGYAAMLMLLSGIAVSAFKLPTPYSFWIDELFSIDISSRDLPALYRQLLSDVHPPLYQPLLKAWISTFGATEPAARTLSWLFAMGTLVVLFRFARAYGHVFLVAALVFVCSNKNLIFYANEARPYAMTMFMAFLMFTAYPFERGEKISLRFMVGCVLLSLSHYFGLILVALVLGLAFVENITRIRNLLRICIAGALSLIWPVNHAINGSLLNKTGGNFWIEVSGIGDSFSIAATGFVPRASSAAGYGLVLVLAASLMGCFYFASRARAEHRAIANIGLRSSFIALTFMVSIAMLDRHTPMSTARNYIVLVPCITLTVASMAALLAQRFPKARNLILAALLAVAVLSLYSAYRSVLLKASAQQDWKGAIQAAMVNVDGRSVYLLTHGGTVFHYLDLYAGRHVVVKPYVPGETKIEVPALLMFGNIKEQELERVREDLKSVNAKALFPTNEVPEAGFAAQAFQID